MFKKINWLIVSILLLGVIYRLIISSNSNFIFNMDNARDMVDVREMVVLGKLRLIGQTTAIDGFFYGPAWYYILTIPFILSGGHPYASILLEILLWAFGGYFLLFLVNKYYGKLALTTVAVVWTASNFILLASQYAFNPNPVIFLTPVFIYLLIEFLQSGRLIYSLAVWFLAGLFLHFEITVGLFMPLVIILAILVTGKNLLFKKRNFWLGILAFIITLIPQLLFELRHDFFLTKSLFAYKSDSHAGVKLDDLGVRFEDVKRSFYDTLLPTFENYKLYLNLILIALPITMIAKFSKEKKLDRLTLISLLIFLVPFIGLLYLKVDLMRWHLNAAIVAGIILSGFVISYLYESSKLGKIVALVLTGMILIFSLQNIKDYLNAAKIGNQGNSIFRNELEVVDFIYKYVNGKNFKAYIYLPSVIDYPYQYLFWWRGLNKYGYLPEDYAYLPNKPEYIKGKEKLDTGSHPKSSGLVFLIKESDQIGQRHLWENSFKSLELLGAKRIGSVEVEIRKDK